MSGTLVPMGTGVPAGIHENLENMGTAGYRVPWNSWVPMGTGYRPEKKFWVPMGTGYRENFHL